MVKAEIGRAPYEIPQPSLIGEIYSGCLWVETTARWLNEFNLLAHFGVQCHPIGPNKTLLFTVCEYLFVEVSYGSKTRVSPERLGKCV